MFQRGGYERWKPASLEYLKATVFKTDMRPAQVTDEEWKVKKMDFFSNFARPNFETAAPSDVLGCFEMAICPDAAGWRGTDGVSADRNSSVGSCLQQAWCFIVG